MPFIKFDYGQQDQNWSLATIFNDHKSNKLHVFGSNVPGIFKSVRERKVRKRPFKMYLLVIH